MIKTIISTTYELPNIGSFLLIKGEKMSPDLTENIINPKDALAIAEVLRGDNPATAPISNEAA